MQRQTAFSKPLLCKVCLLVWLDYGELDVLPKNVIAKEKPLTLEAKKAIAVQKVTLAFAKMKEEKDTPDEVWKSIPFAFHLPIEIDPRELSNTPFITWALTFITFIISVWGFYHFKDVLTYWSFIPSEFSLVSTVSSFFFHTGWLHLLVNLYFLVTFGDDVENFLGKIRYTTLLLLATFFGSILHKLGNMDSGSPTIGASGGLSGIISF